ncbi:phage virion morphogenesis protein [Gemmobacter sp.]|uniref:phage virion morphogenesis protein n=1 Tax=Gemmobacter sp. TaxID=1898957 RepID=UPI002AFE5D51|nr:phage virion morphogenesis protein [Gemmobacter sp.]
MTGISIKVELRQQEARDRLQAILNRMDRKQPFYKSVGERLMASVPDRFRTETDPDGVPWKPLAPATVKARTRKKQLPLTILRSNTRRKSGSALAGSINMQVSEEEVRVGSSHELAAVHQLGVTIQRPARDAKIYRIKDKTGQIGRRFAAKEKANHVTDVKIPAYSITIPARPFLGITKADEAAILDQAVDWLTR